MKMTRAELANWMILYVAVLIGDPPETLSLDTPISEYDFDSIDAVNMALAVEEKCGTSVDAELFLNGDASLLDILDALRPESEDKRLA